MRVALLLLLAGCNQIFGITETRPIDASLPPDASDVDNDGIEDLADNCPNASNPNQRDEDQDSIGDACDNCPNIANTDQHESGDNDTVGDDCDPRPRTGGDCLILFDSLEDSAGFTTRWQLTGTGTSDAHDGKATLSTTSDATWTLTAAAGVALDHVYDVIAHGKASTDVDTSAVYVGSNLEATNGYGYQCGVQYRTSNGGAYNLVYFDGQTASPTYAFTGFTLEPVGREMLVRMIRQEPSTTPNLCVVFLGLSPQTLGLGSSPAMIGGAPGFRLHQAGADISSIAIYERRSDACPAPVIF